MKIDYYIRIKFGPSILVFSSPLSSDMNIIILNYSTFTVLSDVLVLQLLIFLQYHDSSRHIAAVGVSASVFLFLLISASGSRRVLVMVLVSVA